MENFTETTNVYSFSEPLSDENQKYNSGLALDTSVIVEALIELNCTNWIKIVNYCYEGIEWNGEPPITKEQLEQKIEEVRRKKPLNVLRQQRNRLISETDWWVLPDRNPTPEQLAYRQALRDLPDNVNPVFTEDKTDITGFEWPERPA